MARKTKVVGFSLPPELHKKIERLIKKNHKTRSEFFRGIIDVYLKSVQQTTIKDKQAISDSEVGEADLAKVLKFYWLLKSNSKLNIIVVGLGIIVNEKGKVLIGARKTKDKWVENLTWVFPGGKMKSLGFEKEMTKKVKQETNLEVKINTLVASRIHPDSGFKSTQIVVLYFYCTPVRKQEPKAGGDLSKLKWVKPTDVFKYFTTSTSDEVTKFLYSIEKGK